MRVIASGMAMMRLSSVSATYSVPLLASATQVGPIASAALSSRHGMPSATTWSPVTLGAPPPVCGVRSLAAALMTFADREGKAAERGLLPCNPILAGEQGG